MENCIFCKISKGDIASEKIYEDRDFFAFLDVKPINFGHTLIIPKEHYENLYELPDELLEKMAPLIKKISIAVKKGVNADGINIGMNNERAAGQLVMHSHVHIIPRHNDDGYVSWAGKTYENNEEKTVVEKIIKNI